MIHFVLNSQKCALTIQFLTKEEHEKLRSGAFGALSLNEVLPEIYRLTEMLEQQMRREGLSTCLEILN